MRWGVVAGLVLALAVAGCGGGDAGGGPAARPSPSGLSKAKLAGGLLGSYDGFGTAAQPLTGTYASLPTSAAAGGVRDAPPQVKFTPAKCKNAVWSGPDAKAFGSAPAAVVTLGSKGGARLWDQLLAVPGAKAAAALGGGPVAGCDEVHGSYRGRTLSFTEEKAPPLGSGSRGARVEVSGGPATRVVAFAGRGWVGVVYAQGGVSRDKINAFASRAYETARRSLG